MTAYPRIASYGGYRSSGAPLVDAAGVLDLTKVSRLARYGTVVIHANTLHLRPDIGEALRAAGASRILPYVTLTHWWLPASFVPGSSDGSLNAEIHRVFMRTGAFLPNPQLGYEIDWTNDAMARGLADLFSAFVGAGGYDGFFFDYASPDWSAFGNEQRRWNMTRTLSAVRDAIGSRALLVANGIGAQHFAADGLMCEGFPRPFTNFDTALRLKEGAWLKCEDTSARAGRFVLGTACLTGATATWGPQHPAYPDFDRWLPEFDGGGRGMGWLGEALGPYHRHESGAYLRWFDNGAVVVNPTGGTIVLDMLTATLTAIGEQGGNRYFQVRAFDAVFLTRR